MRQFLFPDLGEGLEEAEIVGWHVNEGDHVVVDQPLVSVETDKAVVEVPSPQSGRIARLFGGKGDLVKVGAPLVRVAVLLDVLALVALASAALTVRRRRRGAFRTRRRLVPARLTEERGDAVSR